MYVITRKVAQKIVLVEEGREPIIISLLPNTASSAYQIGIEAAVSVDIILEEKLCQPRIKHKQQLVKGR